MLTSKYIDLARAKSEALDNIYSLLKQIIKSCHAKGDVTRDDSATTILSATQRSNVGTMLQPFETMSQQCFKGSLHFNKKDNFKSQEITVTVKSI